MRTVFGVFGVDDCSILLFLEDTSEMAWCGAQGAWEIQFIYVEDTNSFSKVMRFEVQANGVGHIKCKSISHHHILQVSFGGQRRPGCKCIFGATRRIQYLNNNGDNNKHSVEALGTYLLWNENPI